MPVALRVAMAVKLLLALLEQILPTSFNLLPLCGDHFTELAVLIVAALIYIEISTMRPR